MLEAQEYNYEVGFAAGPTGYLGDAGPVVPFAPPGASGVVQTRYNINFRMAAYLSLGYHLFRGNTSYSESSFPNDATAKFTTSTLLLNPAFEYNFYPYSDKFPFLQTRRLSPYVSVGMVAGVGFGAKGVFIIPGLSGALGLKYKVATRWNLQLQLGGMHFFSDKLEGGNAQADFLNNPHHLSSPPWKGNDGSISLLLGITYEFGSRASDCNKQ